MSKIKELKEAISEIKPIEPIFVIRKSGSNDSLSISRKFERTNSSHPYLTIADLAHDHVSDVFSREAGVYIVGEDETYRACVDFIRKKIVDIAGEVSPATRPRQTKLYKAISHMCRFSDLESKVIDHFISLYFYYVANRQQIKTDSKSVHRKNILGLLTNISSTY